MAKRVSFTAKKAVDLPVADQGLSNSIVRLYSGRLDRTKKDPFKFHRREPLVITNRINGLSTIRFVMGSPRGGIKKDEIAIDYDAVDALGIYFGEEVELDVRPATALQTYGHYINHPDLSVQISLRLALWGVALGVFGSICAVISIMMVFI